MKPKRFYPKTLTSIGDHLRKKRLDLQILQKDMARLLGADETSVNNWEAGRSTPSIAFIPRIIDFLGYVPYQQPWTSLGAKIRAARELLGLSQEALAKYLAIDPTTIRRWEVDKCRPAKDLFKRLDDFFNSFPQST